MMFDAVRTDVPIVLSHNCKVTDVTVDFGQPGKMPFVPIVFIRLLSICAFAGSLFVSDFSAARQAEQQRIPGSTADIQSLILQLGSEDYQTREQAETELLKIGREAIEPVREARSAANSEIRFRARRLLALLSRAEFESRIQEFVNLGSGAMSSSDLSAWNEFSKIVGSERPARELYVAIYLNSPELFDAVMSDPNLARFHYGRLFNPHVRRVAFRSGLEMASLLFVDTIALNENKPDNLANIQSTQLWADAEVLITTANLLSNQTAISFVHTSGFEDEFRRLIKNWVHSLPPDDRSLDAAKMRVIEAHRLKDWLPFVLGTATSPTESTQRRARAITVVAKLGGPSEIKPLQGLLDDRSSVGHFADKMGGKKLREVQIRDIALAASVFLSGQDLESYGFGKDPHRKETFISISQTGFISEHERAQALNKWHRFYRESLRIDE